MNVCVCHIRYSYYMFRFMIVAFWELYSCSYNQCQNNQTIKLDIDNAANPYASCNMIGYDCETGVLYVTINCFIQIHRFANTSAIIEQPRYVEYSIKHFTCHTRYDDFVLGTMRKHFWMPSCWCCCITKLLVVLPAWKYQKYPKNTKNTFLSTIKKAWYQNHDAKTFRSQFSSFKC